MSIRVYFQFINVGLIQGEVFDYVRGRGPLESLRLRIRRGFEVIREFVPWKSLVIETPAL